MRSSVSSFKLSLLEVCFYLLFRSSFGDETVAYQVLHGFQGGTEFECASNVTLQCDLQNRLSSLDWYIDKNALVSKDVAALCSDTNTICQRNPAFSASYHFMFDSPGKYSNLTITPVTIAEENLQFYCNDKLSKNVFTASVIVPPRHSLTVNGTTQLTNGTEYKITTLCIYPANRIKFVWYSPASDGYERKNHTETLHITSKCQSASNNCYFANKSEDVSSVLRLPDITVGTIGRPRRVEVQILFDDKPLFSISAGTYMEADTDDCLSDPCQNGGTCIDKVNGYNCSCQPGYEGTNCDIEITTVTTNISPSKTTTSSVTKSSNSEMKTTTTTTNANANTSLSTSLPTTNSSNANITLPTSLSTTSKEPRKSDQDKRILIYIFAPLGSVIVIVIVIYVIRITRKQKPKKSKETNTVI